jgi:hypothetical protein
VVSIEGEKQAGADASHAHEPGVDQSSSHSGCSLIGWPAVSRVAVMTASG